MRPNEDTITGQRKNFTILARTTLVRVCVSVVSRPVFGSGFVRWNRPAGVGGGGEIDND